MRKPTIFYQIAIEQELDRAEKKWPGWPDNTFEQLSIITEEIGELNQAVLDHKHSGGDQENIIIEAVQSGAMILRFLKELDI